MINNPTNQSVSGGGSDLSPAHERLILEYLDALGTDDFEAQDHILAIAAEHPALEEALWEAQVAVGNELLAADAAADNLAREAAEERLRELIEGALRRPVASNRAAVEQMLASEARADAEAEILEEPEDLTLSHVSARLREDVSRRQVAPRQREAARQAIAQIEAATSKEEVTDDLLTLRGTRSLLTRLGLAQVGAWFEKLVHDALIDLSQTREQESFRLAAARRTRGIQRTIPRENDKPQAAQDPQDDADAK